MGVIKLQMVSSWERLSGHLVLHLIDHPYLTVRLPGARMAPIISHRALSHTRFENSGANRPNASSISISQPAGCDKPIVFAAFLFGQMDKVKLRFDVKSRQHFLRQASVSN